MKFSIFAQASAGGGECYGFRRRGQELARLDNCPGPDEYNAFHAQGKQWARKLDPSYRYEGVDTEVLEEGEEPSRWISPK